MADIVTKMKKLHKIFSCIFWTAGMALLFASVEIHVPFQRYIDNPAEGRAMILTPAILGLTWVVLAQLGYLFTIWQHPGLIYMYSAFLTIIALLEYVAVNLNYVCLPSSNKTLNDNITASDPDQLNLLNFKCTGFFWILLIIMRRNIELFPNIIIPLILFPFIGGCLSFCLAYIINKARAERQVTDNRINYYRRTHIYDRNFTDDE